MAIPRIIHQTYSERAKVHADFERNIVRLKRLNPEWEYCFYDDTAARDFIRARYGMRFVSYFDRIDPRYGPARADFFRYLLMYAMGGVYLDLKSTLKHPLDRVLREGDSYLLSHWQDRAIGVHPGIDLGFDQGELQQWHIVCAPEHPLLNAVIEAVMRNIDSYDPGRDGVGKAGVLRMTGPIAYTRAVAPILNDHSYRKVDIRAECGFEYTIFRDPRNVRSYLSHSGRHYSHETGPIVGHVRGAPAVERAREREIVPAGMVPV